MRVITKNILLPNNQELAEIINLLKNNVKPVHSIVESAEAPGRTIPFSWRIGVQ